MSNEVVFIIGKSPVVDKHVDLIHSICDNYDTMGVNEVATVFKTKYSIFLDSNFKYYTNKLKSKIVITPERNRAYTENIDQEVILQNTYYYTHDKNNIVKDFRYLDSYYQLCHNIKVAQAGFTHDYAISLAKLLKYDKVVLVGIADFTNTYSNTFGGKSTRYACNIIENSEDFIENYASKVLDIVTVNKYSILKIPYEKISDYIK